jgi:hypothetical protein
MHEGASEIVRGGGSQKGTDNQRRTNGSTGKFRREKPTLRRRLRSPPPYVCHPLAKCRLLVVIHCPDASTKTSLKHNDEINGNNQNYFFNVNARSQMTYYIIFAKK